MCVDEIGRFSCDCFDEFTGQNCTERLGPDCGDIPCINQATCVDVQGDFLCICEPAFTGRYCEILFNPCSMDPCLNGTCENTGNSTNVTSEIDADLLASYECTCYPGYTGLQCEVDLDLYQTHLSLIHI